MEKRLLTNTFSMRFAITIFGVLFTDAFFAHRFFNDKLANFKEEMSKLAYRLMHNNLLPLRSVPSQPSSSRRSRPSPTSSCDSEAHYLVKLNTLDGFVGYKQQRCMWCNRRTVWACADCSVAPHSLVPLCPESSNHHGVITYHPCRGHHKAAPLQYPKGKTWRNFGGAKRRRRVEVLDGTDDDALDSEMSCSECE
jgi:hypothetical protein